MASITLTTNGPRLLRLAKALEAIAAAYPSNQDNCVVVIADTDWSVTDNVNATRKVKT